MKVSDSCVTLDQVKIPTYIMGWGNKVLDTYLHTASSLIVFSSHLAFALPEMIVASKNVAPSSWPGREVLMTKRKTIRMAGAGEEVNE